MSMEGQFIINSRNRLDVIRQLGEAMKNMRDAIDAYDRMILQKWVRQNQPVDPKTLGLFARVKRLLSKTDAIEWNPRVLFAENGDITNKLTNRRTSWDEDLVYPLRWDSEFLEAATHLVTVLDMVNFQQVLMPIAFMYRVEQLATGTADDLQRVRKLIEYGQV